MRRGGGCESMIVGHGARADPGERIRQIMVRERWEHPLSHTQGPGRRRRDGSREQGRKSSRAARGVSGTGMGEMDGRKSPRRRAEEKGHFSSSGPWILPLMEGQRPKRLLLFVSQKVQVPAVDDTHNLSSSPLGTGWGGWWRGRCGGVQVPCSLLYLFLRSL